MFLQLVYKSCSPRWFRDEGGSVAGGRGEGVGACVPVEGRGGGEGLAAQNDAELGCELATDLGNEPANGREIERHGRGDKNGYSAVLGDLLKDSTLGEISPEEADVPAVGFQEVGDDISA